MLKSLFFLTYFLFFYHGITNAQITNGCNTANKACYYFSNCAETSNPSNANIATIYTTGDNTVQFQLQYADASVGWIAIGFSDTASMPNTYIFMCQQEGASGFAIQERFAETRTRPTVSSAQLLTEVSSINAGGILNCTFTSPVTRTPSLNNPSGYWILLARGPYNNANIQFHGAGNCISSSRSVITTAAGASSPSNAQITNGCNTENKTCYQFSNCAETSNPSNGNIATIYTTGDNTVQFQMQYADANVGWIAIGFSETASMLNTYIFMCQQEGASGFAIQERFAETRIRPPVSSAQLLTEVSSINAGGILNCTFTSPVTRTPSLNNPSGYWILLARGPYNDANIQFHGAGNCISSSRSVITTAVGSGSTIIPAVRFIYAMLALLFASYAFL